MAESGGDLHRAMGGTEGCRKLAEAFYARVKSDAVLRPLFPGKTLHCAIEEFSAFLVQMLGGPAADTQRRWWLSLRESHSRFRIGPGERAAWMRHMMATLEESGIGEPLRGILRDFFQRSSAHVVNTAELAAADAGFANGEPMRREMARCWATQRALDDAVAAVRSGDVARAIALAEGPALADRLERDGSLLAGLLALMLEARDPALRQFIERRLRERPPLARERYAGRTLLHEAARYSDPAMLELLLRLGADADGADGGGHTALYAAANGRGLGQGGEVVRTLVRGGADVNACEGVKRCTPLHMAARRGNLEIAEALLDSGAAIDPRDSLGDTPLRRAVNCNKVKVAALLAARGADVRSIGSKRLTPLAAARSAGMKEMLASSPAQRG